MVTRLASGAVVAHRYEIDSLVAEGGMAAVYRARHQALDALVALKILSPASDCAVGHKATRFEREARNAVRLDHPGCVRVLDYGVADDGARFLAMELLDGPSLRTELVSGEPCRIDTAAWIGSELLDALAHAHARGVLHRDIKPENVVFTHRGEHWAPVLVDFGLSQLVDDAPLTAAGVCVGSPSYLSPERLLGRGADERSDIYAVGVLLYELIAGVRPFHARTAGEIARMQVYDQAAPLEAYRPDVPPTLAAVIRTAMEKEPARRFASAVAMRNALAAAMAFDAGAHAASGASAARLALGTAPVDRIDASPFAPPSSESTCLALDPPARHRIPGLGRLWSWLCYGAWRWRARTA
jgi:serine/threonine protein kinase